MEQHSDHEVGLGVFEGGQGDDLPKQPRKKMRLWLLVLVSLLSVMLVVTGFYAISALRVLLDVQRDGALIPQYDGRPVAPLGEGAPINVVLMGSDTRGDERGRSDVLIVAHMSADRDRVYLVSFPRDMYVEIPGHGKNKINAAYSFGGVPLAVRTLENLLGVPMDHNAVIDFDGFVGLADEVGGVTIFNRVDSTTASGIHFPRGDLTLSGDKLLAYVRQRHDLPGGDLDRAERQRTVVKAIVLKLMRPGTLTNPVTFNAIASRIGTYFTVDDRLTNARLWELATTAKLRGGADIHSLQAPISGFGTSPEGGAIDIVDTKRMAELAEAMQNDTMEQYYETYGSE